MLAPAITIREATTADIPPIVQLNRALYDEDVGARDPLVDVAVARAEATEHMTVVVTGATSVCFIAILDAMPIGYLAGYTVAPSAFRPVVTARIESIFVNHAWRRQQVGAALTDAFVAWARSNGAEHISVTAYASNQQAIAFYQRYGFTPCTLTLDYSVVPVANGPRA